jgi:hypothetical protein
MAIRARLMMIGRRNRRLAGTRPAIGDLRAYAVRVQAGPVPVHPVVNVDNKAVVLTLLGRQGRRVNRHVRVL